MPNTTPEQVTPEFVQNLLVAFGYWKARAFAAEAKCDVLESLYNQGILAGNPEGWYMLGQVAMQDVSPIPNGSRGVARGTLSQQQLTQQLEAAKIFNAYMQQAPIPTAAASTSGTRTRNGGTRQTRQTRNRTGSSGSSSSSSSTTSSGLSAQEIDRRAESLRKARAVRAERLAAARAAQQAEAPETAGAH